MSRPRLRCGLLVAVAGACALLFPSGCGPSAAPAQGPRQAILILLDAARADRFSSYGYERTTTPNMDSLAAGGLVFTNHFTQGVNTRSALPPLLYSRYFLRPVFSGSSRIAFSEPEDLFRTLDAECVSLPAALAAAGFHTALVSAHPWLTPKTGFAREFAEIHDVDRIEASIEQERVRPATDSPDEHAYHYPRSEKVIDYAIEWITEHQDQEFFLYLHLMDTHTPHFLEEDARYFLGSKAPGEIDPQLVRMEGYGPTSMNRPLNEVERRYLNALYDGSLRYSDRHVGRLIDHLKARGTLDRTLIAVTSDHGENLLEVPGRFGHEGSWNDLIARVPFILRYPPRLSQGRVDSITENVDVMPTLLSLMGVSLPAGKQADGVDLVEVLEKRKEPKRYAFMRRAVRGDRYKAVFRWAGEILMPDEAPEMETLVGELYDLRLDPLEQSNLWSERPDLVMSSLSIHRDNLRGAYRRYRAAVTKKQPTLAFAIESTHFSLNPRVTPTDTARAHEMLVSGSLTGWLRVLHWDDFSLAAGADASPMTISFPVPNGRYRLSVALLGEAALDLDHDQGRVEVAGAAFRAADWSAALSVHTIDWDEPVDVGTIDVRDEMFRVTIHPGSSESPLLVRQFGFEPVVAGEASDPAADQERLERLRGLGYVR